MHFYPFLYKVFGLVINKLLTAPATGDLKCVVSGVIMLTSNNLASMYCMLLCLCHTRVSLLARLLMDITLLVSLLVSVCTYAFVC